MKININYCKYLFAVLLFGTNGLAASHIAMESYEIAFIRTVLGSLFLLALFLITKQKFTFQNHKKHFLFLMISGIALGSAGLFLYEAYSHIGVGISTLMYYCGPVIVIALSPIIFKEKLTPLKISCFTVVLIGMFLINGQMYGGDADLWGIFCGAMCAVMYAIMLIFNKKASDIKGFENAVLQLLGSSIPVVIFLLASNGFSLNVPAEAWPWIMWLGPLNMGIGCYFYFTTIAKLSVHTVSICGYIEPLTAVVTAAVFLGESMTLLQTLGAVMIIGGAATSECFKGLQSPAKIPQKSKPAT